jgi:uncharacterized repeat protein (TIGR01451 family)
MVGAAVVALAVVSVLALGTASGTFSEQHHSAAPAARSATHSLSHAVVSASRARASRVTSRASHSSTSSKPSLSRTLGKSPGTKAATSAPLNRLLAAVTGCGANGTIADKTGFEDNDGNLQVDKAGCVDWNSFAPVTWTGTAPYQSATSTAVAPFTFYGRTDAVNSGSDTSFVNGAAGKEEVDCPGTSAGNIPNKDDLARIYVAGAQSINGDTYIYLAWVRGPLNTPNSDLHVAFEFNQSSTACANGDGLVERTNGDLLIGYEFQSATPTLTLSTWQGGAWSAPVTLTSANSEGGVWVSAGSTNDALKPSGAANPGQDEFGEAGIDLTQAIKGLGGAGRPCETFGSVYGASRTSGQADTADMKDLVGPLPFHVSNCASPTITTQASPSTVNLGETKDISDTATLHSGNAPTGKVEFTLYSDSSCKNAVPGVSGFGAISNVGGSYQASYTKTAWTPTAAGTYYWGVSYAGDNNNNPYSACGGANEEIVVTQPAISITKTADASPVNAGDQIGFTVEVKNTGNGAATGVILNDPLPAGSGSGVTWAVDTTTGTPAQFVLSGAAGHQTLSLASSTLPAGADFTVHITAQTSATECSIYDNTATLTASNAAKPGPASAEEVCNPSDIHIVKKADAAQVSAGDPIGFTLTVYNDGKGDATGVNLSDQLPTNPGLSWSIDAQGAGWGGTCSILAGTLSCGPVTVPAGTTLAASTFTVHITSPTTAATGGLCPASGNVDNTGTVTATNGGTDHSKDTTCVAAPGLHILKKADAKRVDAGDPIGFTLTVYNDGPGNATGVKLSDPLPINPGLSWSVDAQGAGWGGSCSISGGELKCGGAAGVTVPAGTTLAGSTFTVHITSPTTTATGGICPASGNVDNTGTVTATNTGPDHSKDTTCVASPGLHIVKKADAAQVSAGDPIGFTLTVYNNGAGNATGVQLSDPLPTNPGLSWSIDAQGAGWGGSCSIAGGTLSCGPVTVPGGTTLAASTFTVHITSPTTAATAGLCPASGNVDNTGTVTATNAGPDHSTDTTCVAAPGIHIVKTADAAQVNAGDPIGFTLTIYNDGPGNATGVKLSDQLPGLPTNAGLSWSIDAQGAGWGGTCSISGGVLECGGPAGVTVPAGTTQAASTFTVHISSPTTAATGGSCPGTGTVDNTGTVSTTNGGSDHSKASTCVAAPAIHIVKTADAAQVNAGDPIGFTLTVYNDGPGNATGVKLSDQLPGLPLNAGLSWSIASQGAGWGGSCGISGGTLTCGGAAGVTVPAGTTLAGSTFTVHITSPTTAATGGSCPGTGTVQNTGTVTTTNAGSGNSTDSTCVAAPAIHIVKAADAAQVNAGSPIGFTLTVSNAGPGDAKGVKVSDPLPVKAGLSWSIASQGAGWGGSCSIVGGVLHCGGAAGVTVPAGTTQAGSTFTVHVTSPTTAATGGSCPGTGTVDNTGTVTAANGGTDQSSASTCVAAPAIHIVKTADAAEVNAGSPIGFTLTVYNDGSGAATGVKVSDPLPSKPGLSWAIASQGAGWGGSCSISGGVLSCGGAAGVTVPAGTTLAGSSFTVHITSPTTAATGGTCPSGSGVVDNTGTVTTTNAGSGSSGSSTCVQNQVDLSIAKSGAPNPDTFPGDITWTIVVTDNGPGSDTGVTVSDPVPADNTFVSVKTTQGSCTGGAVVSCNIGSMAAGDSVTITLVTKPHVTGNVKNTAIVVGTQPETNTANNQASATVLVVGPHKPPKQYCTAVAVRPNQLYVGRKTTMHMLVKRHGKRVAGVRVRMTGPRIHVTTKRSNSKGAITRALRPTRAGIIIFRPIATKSCKTPRVGITGIFTPPVTG